jgi:hypothetical protein
MILHGTMILHDPDTDTPVVRVEYTRAADGALSLVSYDDRPEAVAHSLANLHIPRGIVGGPLGSTLAARLARLVNEDYNGTLNSERPTYDEAFACFD